MFDFRYHALSLAAVFLALGIGIVLGVTAGNSLVSEADQNIRDSLRGNVEDARRQAREDRAKLQGRDKLIDSTFGALAGSRLRGRRVAIVGFGGLPGSDDSAARQAIDGSSGTLDSTTTIPRDIDLGRLAQTLGPRFRGLARSDGLATAAGRRIGRAIVRGGRRAAALEKAFGDDFAGDYRGSRAVAYLHTPEPDRAPGESASQKRDRDRAAALERGLIAGLRTGGRPVVGVERSDTDPSQIDFYEQAGLSSVDSIDTPGGRLALVLALDGARGRFGFKPGADRPLPDARPPPARRPPPGRSSRPHGRVRKAR